MNKLGIFTATAVIIIGAIAIWAASTASAPFAPVLGPQIEPLPMMARSHGLPAQRMTDFSLVFVAPTARP
jgi:uncharacterized protein YggT (Ycf19 family)